MPTKGLPPDANRMCHKTGFKESCAQHCMSCAQFVKVSGNDPQTGEHIDEFGCADSYKHTLEIETQRLLLGLAADLERLGNQIEASNKLVADSMQKTTLMFGRIAVAAFAHEQQLIKRG